MEKEQENNYFSNSFNSSPSPICLGFLPMEPLGMTIMAMGQLFDDQRRR